jgi:23S rRNA G2445 N2-methylase RlmL
VEGSITFHQGECRDWQFEKMDGPLLAVCNPPWGLRLLSGECSRQAPENRPGGRAPVCHQASFVLFSADTN